ncbi:Annexin [Westerdykella ornata]|uniref:Annexin n=1 Tax=Westerdykella ornata TaxID=318751 RepID=A0A6A6JDW8_WESOR|nr:Annexin [Westerdykella ornata]KAF2274465.1 Annexin [Westerdykella ornata]
MSTLRPDDRKGRSRSKSPGRGRERSRSNVRAPSPGPQHYTQPHGSLAEHAYGHGGATPQPQYELRQPGQHHATQPGSEPITMGNYTDLPPDQRPAYIQQAQAAAHYQYTATAERGPVSPGISYAQPNIQYATTGGQYAYTPAPATQGGPTRNPSASGGFQYAAPPDKITFTAKPVVPTAQAPPPVRHAPTASQSSASQHSQLQPQSQSQPQQQYYTSMPAPPPPPPQPTQQQYPPPPPGPYPGHSEHHRTPSHGGHPSAYNGHHVVEVTPQGGGKLNAPPSPGLRPHSHSVSGGRPDNLTNRMERLSVSGNRPDIQTLVPGGYHGGGEGSLPPPSPMLEAYHGVYQSISPMPHALMLPDDDIDHLQPLDSLSPRGSSTSLHGGRRRAHSSASRRSPSPARRSKHKDKLAMAAYGSLAGASGRDRDREKEKRVKIYDAEEDALALVDALSSRPPDADTLIDILPILSHDQMMELRSEYKRHCKVQGRGINIAKHIKLKTSGNFGKIAYVTALGRYESEGYWANYWYQSGNARRELLIEALMGRQNYEIREIKDAFKDKRYGDSLTRCMDKELKADKFRRAVLMALEGERQEESDVWDVEYRNRDVDTLYKALKAREGGESAMLNIIVMRSDAHLREVLRTYERKYGGNFAREALRKSNNLVGEVIAHILNGVINRPSRDAMLLHHALMDLIEPSHSPSRSSSNKESSSAKHERQQRYELLISRLVRLHWDRMHLARVKAEYEEKYKRLLEEDIEEATKGDFREFCLAICQTGR